MLSFLVVFSSAVFCSKPLKSSQNNCIYTEMEINTNWIYFQIRCLRWILCKAIGVGGVAHIFTSLNIFIFHLGSWHQNIKYKYANMQYIYSHKCCSLGITFTQSPGPEQSLRSLNLAAVYMQGFLPLPPLCFCIYSLLIVFIVNRTPITFNPLLGGKWEGGSGSGKSSTLQCPVNLV